MLHAGAYDEHVKFNDEHVPESPATLYIAPESGDAKKITLVGLRDRGLEVAHTHTHTHTRLTALCPELPG